MEQDIYFFIISSYWDKLKFGLDVRMGNVYKYYLMV